MSAAAGGGLASNPFMNMLFFFYNKPMYVFILANHGTFQDYRTGLNDLQKSNWTRSKGAVGI